jgi:hypothetical protein
MICKVPRFYIAGFLSFTVLANGYELKHTFETATHKHWQPQNFGKSTHEAA